MVWLNFLKRHQLNKAFPGRISPPACVWGRVAARTMRGVEAMRHTGSTDPAPATTASSAATSWKYCCPVEVSTSFRGKFHNISRTPNQ